MSDNPPRLGELKSQVELGNFRILKSVRALSAAAFIGAALLFAVSHAAVGSPSTPNPGPNFTISSMISSSPTSQTPALLYPGVQRFLWYTVSNPLQAPITVNSVGITNAAGPSGCPISNLNLRRTRFSGSLLVSGKKTNSVSVPISLRDTNTNQDGCEGITFNFSYSGSATYTEVYGTVAAVNSASNPSLTGQSVAYTATVTASAAAGQDPVPSSPTGTVTFMDGSSTICSSVSLTSSGTTTSTATCNSPVYDAPGPHAITAIYSNGDGNFSGSTSPIFDQVVAS